ncbi:MAG: GNAT family N-acetyltransferase [Nitrososphaerales archaeon]
MSEEVGTALSQGIFPDFIREGVVFLSQATLPLLNPYVWQVATEMSKVCFGGELTIYPQEFTGYRSFYLLLYVENTVPDQVLTSAQLDELLLNTTITSMGLFYFFPDGTIEIYSVCTKPEYQKGGRVSKMFRILEEIMNFSVYKRAQLAIDFHNPMYATVLRTYLKLGFFRNAEVNERSLHINYAPRRYFFLEKILDGVVENLDHVYSFGLISRYHFFESYQCQYNIYIPPEEFRFINRNLLRGQVEFAGNFEGVGETVIDGRSTQVLKLGKNIIVGSEESVGSSTNPVERFQFHTHPITCYVKYQCLAGWPSNNDFAWSLHIFAMNQCPVSMVCSIEGIYIIYLTIPMQILLSMTIRDTDFRRDLMEFFQIYYQEANQYRETLEFQEEIMVEINNLTMEMMLTRMVAKYGGSDLLERISKKIDRYGLQFILVAKPLELYFKLNLDVQRNGVSLNFLGLNEQRVCRL